MGQISQFIGIECHHWVKHSDDDLSVTLINSLLLKALLTRLAIYKQIHLETRKIYFACSINLWLVVLIGWLILPDQICPQLFHCWINIRVILLQVIMKQPKMLFITTANTRDLGIKFTSDKKSLLESFLHFPVPKENFIYVRCQLESSGCLCFF
jgi:hypothetical protein